MDEPHTPDGAPALHAFADADSAARALSGRIEAALRAALADRGQASLMVSGGSSPAPLYRRLSQADLDWRRVSIVLADERWVAPGAPGSNEDFLRATLLQGPAAAACFIGLKTPHARAVDAVATLNARLEAAPHPFDAAVLGMGTDGHTLSWFPQADGLDAALATDQGWAAAITAPESAVTGPYVERMTLTRAALAGVRVCALVIAGAAKRQAFDQAAGPGPVAAMPVRALMRDPDLDLQTYWWP